MCHRQRAESSTKKENFPRLDGQKGTREASEKVKGRECMEKHSVRVLSGTTPKALGGSKKKKKIEGGQKGRGPILTKKDNSSEWSEARCEGG